MNSTIYDNQNSKKVTFGIVGGLGPLAGADIFFKLVKSTPAYADSEHFNIILEQQPFSEVPALIQGSTNLGGKVLPVINTRPSLLATHVPLGRRGHQTVPVNLAVPIFDSTPFDPRRLLVECLDV